MANLRSYNSFRVNAEADHIVIIQSKDEIQALYDKYQDILLLGEGSNILICRDIECAVVNQLKGIEVVEEEEARIFVRVASGENWDNFINIALKNGWYGLENLALIPGTVGAAPVQNIGAYGVEVAQLISFVHVIDLATGSEKTIDANDCGFGYRDSKFKREWSGKYFIESVEFRLNKVAGTMVNYGGLKAQLNSENPSPNEVAEAVRAIRRSKLPDPKAEPNAGSFFKNPIIRRKQAVELAHRHPDMPQWKTDNGVKVSAAWLIEKAGLKGVREGDVGVSKNHSLIVINFGDASGNDILSFGQKIIKIVNEQFGVELEIEPQVIQ